jgi:hypothetical protein
MVLGCFFSTSDLPATKAKTDYETVGPLMCHAAEASADTRIVPLTAAGLIILCVSLAILIGNIGFQGDDWWQFSWPYWHSFPNSVWEYAKASRRPVEGLYTVLAFEAFGLNRVFYTLAALSLSAGACLLMGTCLRRAFPGRESLMVLSVLFAFLLTPVSNLIYMFHTDNSRISLLVFWASVWAFQRWAWYSKSWPGLTLPVLVYLLAAFTYENTTFLIFSVPLLVWPIHVRHRNNANDLTFLLRLCSGIAVGFAFFVGVRFAVFSGGAVGHSSLVPPAGLIWSYLSNLALYCLAPFSHPSSDKMAWVWGFAVAVIAALLLVRAAKSEPSTRETVRSVEQSSLYIAMLGIGILAFGMLPYLMAGYEPSLGFTSQSRIYSSGSFGLAILLALAFSTSSKRLLLSAKKIVAVIMIAVMAAFLAGLRANWLEAAAKRDKLYDSLLGQVPNVVSGTTFLFLDLQSYLADRGIGNAVVVQGVDGMDEFIKMLYHNKNLYAYFLYPEEKIVNDTQGRKASVSPEGFVARGSAVRAPIPLDSLLILKRVGDKLVLIDKLSLEDGAAIDWNGVSHVRSNPELVLPASATHRRLTGSIAR